MEIIGENLVAGVFATRAQAEAAREHLHRIGLPEEKLEVRAPKPGRYQIEDHASSEIGAGIVAGIVGGIPIGSLGGLLLFAAAFPAFPADRILLGILVGAFWGAFYGGVIGMAAKVRAHIDDACWCDISVGSPEAVLIAHAGDRVHAGRKVMQRRGALCFLTELTATRSVSVAPTRAVFTPLRRSA